MKKVSIIVPFFNGLIYFSDCLESIIDQELDPESYEVICLGDAPEEGIVSVIEKYEKLGVPIRYSQWFENKGTCYSRNKGLSLAEGEYIYFMDSDDYLMPGCIKRLVECADNNDASVVRGDIVETGMGKLGNVPEEVYKECIIDSDKKGNDMLLARIFENEVTVLNMLIKREVLIENDILFPEDVKYFGDMGFVMELLCSVEGFFLASKAVLCKRMRNSGSCEPSLMQMYENEKDIFLDNLLTIYGKAKAYPSNQPKRLNIVKRTLCDTVLMLLDEDIKMDRKNEIRCAVFVKDAMSDIQGCYTIVERMALMAVSGRQIKAAALITSIAANIRKVNLHGIAKKIVVAMYKIMNTCLPVSKKTVVFSSALGRSYAGNPRAIYKRMVEEGLDKKYRCVWFYDNRPHDIEGRHKSVRYKGLKYLFYMSIAGIWIFDARQPSFLRKKDKVVYLQTWHGTPLKKLGLDLDNIFMSGEDSVEAYKEEFARNVRTWDMLISQNSFSTEIFRRAFAFEKKMLEIGYPRNDSLILKNNSACIEEIKKKYNLPQDKKIILYAPTWRDDEANGPGSYSFSNALDMAAFREAFEDEYVLAVKYHYLVKDTIDWSIYDGFVRTFDESMDISDIYLVSDILITDYSSVMFDYSILRRPMYFYCYDIEKYKNVLRGFYFDFEDEAPGPISFTTGALIDDIKADRAGEYREKYERFNEKYNPWDNGEASKKVLEYLFKEG